MSPSHHLSAETLLDYSAGAMVAAMQTLVACHLTVCPACRERSVLADDLGGAVLRSVDPTPVRGSVEQLLSRCDEPAWVQERESPGGAQDNDVRPMPTPGVPRPLGRLLGRPLEALDWRRVAPGIKQVNLTDEPRRKGAFRLLHLAPGAVLSGHTHNERELTYVVRGSYHDEIGRFREGDIADLDGNVVHRPVVDTDEPCIALIATDSPVRYSGVLGRLMQPLVGI